MGPHCAFCTTQTAEMWGKVRAGVYHIRGGLVYKVSRRVPGLPSSSQNLDFVLAPLDLNSVSLAMDPTAPVGLVSDFSGQIFISE